MLILPEMQGDLRKRRFAGALPGAAPTFGAEPDGERFSAVRD